MRTVETVVVKRRGGGGEEKEDFCGCFFPGKSVNNEGFFFVNIEMNSGPLWSHLFICCF